MMVRRKHINDAVSTARSKQDDIYIAIIGVTKIKGIQKEKNDSIQSGKFPLLLLTT